MTTPSDKTASTPVRRRRPRAGTRNRGGADALQTKLAIDLQNLDPARYHEQLQANIAEMPDAAGCDTAFLALISEDGSEIETIIASSDGFAQSNPELLIGEKLDDWHGSASASVN